jgi:hypothetical protein
VIVIQAALLVAVQAQPEPVVTLNEPLPPVDGAAYETALSVNVHGVPACVTV